ncbi:MAG: Holliday junction branch migration protein RuvA [Bacteroidota bacterium]|nr:Holliday junction branch migration protein RuvA [Bacteroidota bacterium]
MLSYLTGKLTYKTPTEIVIDVNGVGYSLNISLTTYEQLSSANDQVKVFTYLHVREDALLLFGFSSESEREMFKLLISVSGIGPKIAQGMLSGMTADELKSAIQTGDIAALTSLQGVGRKTAERLLLELRDKIGKAEIELPSFPATSPQIKTRNDALNALISLGYNRNTAENAIREVLKENKDLSVEELIRQALRHTSK